MDRSTIVVLEADRSVLDTARAVFAGDGVEVQEAASARAALEFLRSAPAAVLIADAALLGDDPAEWLGRAARLRPALVSIVLARSEGGRLPAVPGAFDVLEGPPARAALRRAGERALEHHRLLDQLRTLRHALKTSSGFAGLVGRSEAAERLRARIERLAPGTGSVLFQGEPGSGRRSAAQALHEASARAAGPFVTLDLGGDEPVGAAGGRLAAAKGGTLYVEGLERLDPSGPSALLALLARAGDVRLLAGATEDLFRALVREEFGDEILALLAGDTVHVPALRDRSEDVAPLARHLAETIRAINALPEIRFAPETLDLLERYPWPGNVRELRHVVEHALTVCADGVLRPVDLPEEVRRWIPGSGDGGAVSAERRFRQAKRTVVDEFERLYLADLLRRHRGNVTSAATHAGMLRSALQRLLRKHELRSHDFRLGERSGSRDRSS